MKIVDAFWTARGNVLVIQCSCGNKIQHPANRWKVVCPVCSKSGNLQDIRQHIELE